MLQSLCWRGGLNSPDAEEQLHELRTDALRLFLVLTTVGYLAWHGANTVPPSTSFPADSAYLVLPVALLILAGTWMLISRNGEAATVVFVGGGLLGISWALYVLDAAQVSTLFPVLALIAAFVINPLGGFVVAGLQIGLLVFLGSLRPGLVSAADVWNVAIFAVLAVVGVWVLTHRLFLALNWYVDSYAKAERRTREAEEHRAQLVQAWTQLDSAYYRLERANAALQLAWKAADEAERSKMELATNISHELRTPLNLIVGYSEMMMTSPGSYGGVPLPQPYRGDLNAIYRSAQHLLALTDDVLDLARMEVGHLGLLREPVDLGQVIRDAAALVSDYVEAKGLELRLELPDDLPTLMLDRLRIRQVLLNLLTNAARFTEHGHIEVSVLRRESGVRVAVADTGPGIAPDDLPRVFQEFATQDRPRPDWRSGTGLGLPISKRFVELHGGEMGVESVVGAGTTFWFTLPLAIAKERGATLISTGPAHVYSRQQERVLVLAHAEAGLARLLQRHLRGYRVEVAEDLVDATARATKLKATAIIADLDESTGVGSSPVPVVRCTLPRLGRLAQRLRVADYLVKPVSRDALLRAIRQLECPISRVLIVDDDTRFVRLLNRMLSANGRDYLISTAHNGEEALAKMRACAPDLLLLDLAMPGLDGVGVLNEMAAAPELRDVRVIVISAREEGESTVPLGGELRISKPEGFRLAELTQVIEAAVSKLAPVRAYLADTEPAPSAERPD